MDNVLPTGGVIAIDSGMQKILQRAARGCLCLLVTTATLGTASLTGCGGGSEGEAAGVEARYTVRGRVVSAPSAERPQAEFIVLHEEIADWKNEDGEVVGMEVMAMGFGVGPDASLEGVSRDDPVEMDVVVRWQPTPEIVAVRVTELPADTPLALTVEDAGNHATDNGESCCPFGAETQPATVPNAATQPGD